MRNDTPARFCAALLCAAVTVLPLTACADGSAGSAVPGSDAAASSVQAEAQAAPQGTGTALDDGALRMLWGGPNSTDTVFCGAQVIYTAPTNGVASLLSEYDWDSGSELPAEYFLTGEPDGSDQFLYTIRDKAGNAVYTCAAGESVAGVAGGWALIHASDWSEGGPVDGNGAGHFVSLITGESRPAPDFASAFFRLNDDCFGTSVQQWDAQTNAAAAASYLYDAALQPTETIDGWSAAPAQSEGGWLQLSQYGAGSAAVRWYQPSTGTYLENVIARIGHNVVSVQNADGTVSAVALDTGKTLAVYDRPCTWYAGGCALTSQDDTAYPLVLHRADGTSANARISNTADGTTIVLLQSSAEAYDDDGKLLYTLPLDLPQDADGQSCMLTPLSGGRFLLQVTDGQGYALCALYGADGLIRDLTDIGYSTVYVPYNDPDCIIGARAVSGGRPGTLLYDLLDSSGKPLLTNLATIVPAGGGIFDVRLGFEEGWADDSGSFLWKRNIWQSADDETSGGLWD